MESEKKEKRIKLKNVSLSLILWLILSLELILVAADLVGYSGIWQCLEFSVEDIFCLTIIDIVAVFMLMIRESRKAQVDNVIYNSKKLLSFYFTSNTFKLLILFVTILIYLESYSSSNLISEMKRSNTDSTAGLIIYYIVLFMIVTNAVVVYAGEIISARKVKKTFIAKILMLFSAIILTISIMIVCDVLMPNRTFYIFVKALYLV